MKRKFQTRIVIAAIAAGCLCGYGRKPAPPRIYLTPLQCADLGDPGNESEWPVVQNHLQGLWFNNAGNSDDQTRRIILRLKKETYPIILPFSFRTGDDGLLTYNTPAWGRYQNINRSLDGNKVLTPTHMIFDCTDVSEGRKNLEQAIAAIHAARKDPAFADLASGVVFSPRHGLDDPSSGTGTYLWRTRQLIDAVDGMAAIEMSPWRMRLPRAKEGFINICNYAKSKGLAFTWLMNRGVGTNNEQWIEDIDRALKMLEKDNIHPDIIAISNQGDNSVELLPRVPEKDDHDHPADTITGGLYRLLTEFDWADE